MENKEIGQHVSKIRIDVKESQTIISNIESWKRIKNEVNELKYKVRTRMAGGESALPLSGRSTEPVILL